MIRKEVVQRIVNHLKGTSDADGAFRHFVRKKSGFALVDLQSVGIIPRLHDDGTVRNGSAWHGTEWLSSNVYTRLWLCGF